MKNTFYNQCQTHFNDSFKNTFYKIIFTKNILNKNNIKYTLYT